MSSPDGIPEADEGFRWQGWLRRSQEAVFLLSGGRRLVFANRAWEKATGLLLKEVRGRVCRRRPRSVLADKTEHILGALAPPVEAWKGSPCQSRRLLPGIGRPNFWVELAYLPLGAGESLVGVVGVIKALPEAPTASPQPLPEKWLALRDRLSPRLDDWEGDSPGLARVVSQVRLAASQPGLPVTIVGGRGTGKLTLGRTLHQLSPWRQRFFACLDCERLPDSAVAEVLFPREEKTATPLGVLLLKEPGRLPRETQAQLLALIENQEETSPWLLAAFREDPEPQVQSGQLLEGLHYRLSTIVITLPTVRERRADVPRLVEAALRRFGPLLESAPSGLSGEALEHLKQHAWPGNLHELNRVMLSAAERAGGGRIEASHLPFYLRSGPPAVERTFKLDEILEQVERRMLTLALRLSEGSKTKASHLLGIWRARLLRRMEALGIEDPGRETAE